MQDVEQGVKVLQAEGACAKYQKPDTYDTSQEHPIVQCGYSPGPWRGGGR